MGEVVAFRGKGVFPKEALIELAQNTDLLFVQIVCHWKGDEECPNGFTTVGWSPDLTNSAMIYGARHMMLTADEVALGD